MPPPAMMAALAWGQWSRLFDLVDFGRATEFAPHHHGDVLAQPAFVQIQQQSR
jgi:hypothetical protein